MLRTGVLRGRTFRIVTRHTRPAIAGFQQWVPSGVMKGILEALAKDLKIRGLFDLKEAFIDGSFAPAKQGALRSAKQ
ncbi:MAG: hypothetical protein WCA13_09470 [Terriglobales bacterium]